MGSSWRVGLRADTGSVGASLAVGASQVVITPVDVISVVGALVVGALVVGALAVVIVTGVVG